LDLKSPDIPAISEKVSKSLITPMMNDDTGLKESDEWFFSALFLLT